MASGHGRDYIAIAEKYAREATKDKKGARYCAWVRKAAARHLDDLKRRTGKDWPYKFDEWHANDVCDYIEKLPHIEGEWETPEITLEPAQVFILVATFGWRHAETGARRFRQVYIELARKNAKSTLAAGVALYCLTCEGEQGPQVIIGATTGAQANKVFNPAKRMVEKTPDLQDAFGLSAWARSITCRDNGGYIQPINAKSSTQDGWNPHCGILDELHAHKERGLYDVIKSAFGARKNPLLWIITTAGYDVQGVCYEQRTLVTKILDGLIDAPHYFGIIYTLDEGDDPLDPAVWIKSNPLLGVSVQHGELEGYATEARYSPDTLGEFQTKRLNVWTAARSAWLSPAAWAKCGGPVDITTATGPVWAGLDLASTSDISALVVAWEQDGRLKAWCRFYVPEAVVTPRTERGNVPYQRWVQQGHLIATPGDVTDYTYIKADIEKLLEHCEVRGIAYDPWNASHLVNELVEQGAPMIGYRQGIASFNAPMKELERRVKSNELDHAGNPVLAWMASNIVVRRDVNDNIAPDKKNSQEKIDGIVALAMALGMMMSETDTGPSVYESRGVLAI